MIIIMKM